MNKTAACCLALSLYVCAASAYSVWPGLRSAVARPVATPTGGAALAVLAADTTPPAAIPLPSSIITSMALSQNDENPVTAPVRTESATAAPPLLPTAHAPALAPATTLLALPTVTPTPPPVKVADAGQIAVPAAAVGTVLAAATTCEVTSPPAALGLDPFYAKYCSTAGIPIVASADVPDRALRRAGAIVAEMLSGMTQAGAVRAALTDAATHIGVIGASQVTTDLPEHRGLYVLFPDVDWNTRARGVGATAEIPLLSIAEENLLCYASDRWIGQNVLIHEFAHTIKKLGLERVDPAFAGEVRRAYAAAQAAGLWSNTYVGSDAEEYWAEGVRLYFQVEPPNVPGAQPYPANTRAELEHYDPALYRLVEDVFGPRPGIPTCPSE